MTPELIMERAMQRNMEHFEARQFNRKSKYSSIIAKFFKSYNKPLNMEKNMKYVSMNSWLIGMIIIPLYGKGNL